MATIVMASSQVIEAAEKTIAHIMAERANKNEALIAEVMEEPRRSLLFRKFYYTREQAIEYIINLHRSRYSFPSQYAWGDLIKAQNLLRIAQHGDPVTLNEDDVRVLF